MVSTYDPIRTLDQAYEFAQAYQSARDERGAERPAFGFVGDLGPAGPAHVGPAPDPPPPPTEADLSILRKGGWSDAADEQADDDGTLVPGMPHFWNILTEKLALEFLYGVNWVTILPALFAFFASYSGHLSWNIGSIAIFAMGGLNAAARAMADASKRDIHDQVPMGMLSRAIAGARARAIDKAAVKRYSGNRSR